MFSSDLHMHSKYSPDGEFDLKDIILRAKEKNIKNISITDHNCVRAIPEAMELGKEYHVNVIPGVEIDCSYEGTNLHILGYNIDFTDSVFEEIEKQINEEEMKVLPDIIKSMKEEGIVIDVENVMEEAKGQIPTAELIAEIVLHDKSNDHHGMLKAYRDGGKRSDQPYLNFYLDHFKKGKKFYFEKKYPNLEYIVDLIKNSGGIPMLAHPGESLRGKEQLLPLIIKTGVCGLEAFSSYHNRDDIKKFITYVVENNLLFSCGSDYHGKNKPLIDIGDTGYDESLYQKEKYNSFFLLNI